MDQSAERVTTAIQQDMSEDQFLEDPSSLLQETRSNFSITNDTESLDRISSNLTQLQSTVKEKLVTKQRQVHQLQVDFETFQSVVETLEDKRKGLMSDAEQQNKNDALLKLVDEMEKLEQELVTMRSELDQGMGQLIRGPLADLETEDKGQNSEQEPEDLTLRANILKLKLYRSLGVILDTDNNQALIRQGNDESKLDVLPLEDDLSDYFKTKYIWDRL